MKILVRKADNKRWRIAESVEPKEEKELQNLLLESPSLLSVDEIREGVTPLVFASGEVGLPGSGNTDLLAFSGSGDIAIIECKRAANNESKRKVIGQILEYAAHLWTMSYDEVDERIQRREANKLLDLVRDAAGEDFEEEVFMNGVAQALEEGSFILVIVVDEINPELRRIIRYINECSDSAFSLHALELPRFKAGTTQVLVPRVHGASGRQPSKRKTRVWTESEFFGLLSDCVAEETAEIVTGLYEWGKGIAYMKFGTGTKDGSFTLWYTGQDPELSVFAVNTNGRLYVNYNHLSRYLGADEMERFDKRMRRIPPFKDISKDFTRTPSFEISKVFADPRDLAEFKKVVRGLRK